MIHIFICGRNLYTMTRLRQAQSRLGCLFKVHSYASLFGRREVPLGTLVFTDFDHLHSYEIDVATIAMNAALEADPATRVLNAPHRALQRTALLNTLAAKGLSTVEAIRLDTGALPTRYPVFLRQEAGAAGPETDILPDEAAFRAALADMDAMGRSRAGRISLSFEAEKDKDGYYRKYGAFVIGDHIVPQHILRSPGWNVKSAHREADRHFLAEEQAFLADNPHADALREIASAGGIQFGRIDYGLKDGKFVVFEINTNPTFPNFIGGNPARNTQRALITQRLAAAFQSVEGPATRRTARFSDDHLDNAAFVERDHWLWHPHIALRQKDHWRRILSRIRWQGLFNAERWQRAIGKRWNNLRFRLSRLTGGKGT